ncbi:hypothetical protein L6164_012360 [Bauhinia variegata]|uniref:Uncharacterized protein n=1 Tax=Bauhinia variegata TaxID=167791 RepID=A0ACB9P9A6_BAUVA|nr:hypothetical protein L6164_012360 [Bauhinia variegata]
MMLGGHQIMRRTRSISGGMSADELMPKSDDHRVKAMQMCPEEKVEEGKQQSLVKNSKQDLDLDDEGRRLLAAKGAVSSATHGGSAATTTCIPIQQHSTPHFLRTCGLCKQHLAPSRDIYMYRGDTAFCSLECREEHMKVEERKDKAKVSSKSNYKKQDHHTSSSNSKPSNSTKAPTMAAA